MDFLWERQLLSLQAIAVCWPCVMQDYVLSSGYSAYRFSNRAFDSSCDNEGQICIVAQVWTGIAAVSKTLEVFWKQIGSGSLWFERLRHHQPWLPPCSQQLTNVIILWKFSCKTWWAWIYRRSIRLRLWSDSTVNQPKCRLSICWLPYVFVVSKATWRCCYWHIFSKDAGRKIRISCYQFPITSSVGTDAICLYCPNSISNW